MTGPGFGSEQHGLREGLVDRPLRQDLRPSGLSGAAAIGSCQPNAGLASPARSMVRPNKRLVLVMGDLALGASGDWPRESGG